MVCRSVKGPQFLFYARAKSTKYYGPKYVPQTNRCQRNILEYIFNPFIIVHTEFPLKGYFFPYQPKQDLYLRGMHFNLVEEQELELDNLGSKDPAT